MAANSHHIPKNSTGWLVVGAGFTGASAARRLAETTGEKILVIDRRDHVGGNAYDEQVSGIRVHRYGPHIFHTNSDQVWNFLSRFTRWRPYEHRVQAMIDGRGVPLPFNFNSIRACFAAAEAERLIVRLTAEYGARTKVPVLKLLQSRDAEISALGRFIYDNIFLNYTTRLWGVPPDALQPSVTARVPIYLGEDDRYFHDRYQAMPADGFVALFESMLDHPNIEVALRTNFADLAASDRPRKVLYTGAIDEYFGWRFGALEYRSLRFHHQTQAGPFFQPVGTVNFPAEPELLRISEPKHMTGDDAVHTVITREYPQKHVPGVTEAFYPMLRREPDSLMPRYQAAAAMLQGSVCFGGRLADYQYYNMDQACARGLMLADRQLASVA
jgi:UDP-galactopyranose mutase